MTDAEIVAAMSGGGGPAPAEKAKPLSDSEILQKLAAQKVGSGEAGMRGYLQGATLGTGDTLAALGTPLADWLAETVHPDLPKIPAVAGMKQMIDSERERNALAQEAHPWIYGGAQAAGGVPLDIALSGGVIPKGGGVAERAFHPMTSAIGQGAVGGIGYTDADRLADQEKAALVGGGIGAALGGVSSWLGGKGAALEEAGASRVAAANAGRAGQVAGEDLAALRSNVSTVGGTANAIDNTITKIEKAVAEGSLSSEETAAVNQLKASGQWDKLIARRNANLIQAAPHQLSRAESASGELQNFLANREATNAARYDQLGQTQVLDDALSLFKSYGEPSIGAAIGHELSGATGGLVGGNVLARTRMGKALQTRIMRPGHQIALGNLQQAVGGAFSAGGSQATHEIEVAAAHFSASFPGLKSAAGGE